MTELENKIYATILGGAIGDALGVPVEFKARDTFNVSEMTGHGTHNQPRGTWSDDTSLTLCLMECLVEGGDLDALMDKFSRYCAHGYMAPYGECFDIGGTTAKAIRAFNTGTPARECGQSGENDNGNGSLMRIAPIAFITMTNEIIASRLATVERYSGITHAHPRSVLGCFIYIEFLQQLYLEKEKNAALSIAVELCAWNLRNTRYEAEFSHYQRILSGEIGVIERDGIRSGGYVVDTLEAAIWCFLKNDSFRDVALEAVNLGGDTDTTGMVAGSLAGMHYGLEGLPDKWVNALAKVDDIKKICQDFSGKLLL